MRFVAVAATPLKNCCVSLKQKALQGVVHPSTMRTVACKACRCTLLRASSGPVFITKRPSFIHSAASSMPSTPPNPSLKLTRYGMRCKPGVRQLQHRHTPGLQHMPPRAA